MDVSKEQEDKIMTEKDRIQYIQVLLALDGHNDYDIHETLNKAQEIIEEKPSFWKTLMRRCGIGCGTSAANP